MKPTLMAACYTLALVACGVGQTSAEGALAVMVHPSTSSLPTGGEHLFVATVNDVLASPQAISWEVQESGGGTVDGTGLYTAPASTGLFHVVARLTGDLTKAATATVTVSLPSSTDTTGLIPADRRTEWNPGVVGGIPHFTTVHATIPVALGDGVQDATAAINNAIAAAGAVATAANPQVVLLPPGTFRVSSDVRLNQSYVVLRGAGPTLTTIDRPATASGQPVVSLGYFWGRYGPDINITADVPKGATSVSVSSSAGLAAGDLILIDQLDDPTYLDATIRGNWIYNKRGDNNDGRTTVPGAYRSMGSYFEVAAVSGNTVFLSSPTHLPFRVAQSAQVKKSLDARKYVGLEDLRLRGGRSQTTRAINVSSCWMRNVNSDTTDGTHLSLAQAYRCEIRDSYFHDAVGYNSGANAYGIYIVSQSSSNLIENNIVRHLNKPVLFVASGGGNVVGYNYVDESIIGQDAGWLENGIGTHGSFPFMELIEGNYVSQMNPDNTHGASGWLTWYRNRGVGQNTTYVRTTNLGPFVAEANNLNHNVLGNVLGFAGMGGVYSSATANPVIYRLGGYADPPYGTRGRSDVDPRVEATLIRHGNFDYVTNAVQWVPAIVRHEMPASLYRAVKPAFFGNEIWPYVDPTRMPMVGNLPAKLRYEAMP